MKSKVLIVDDSAYTRQTLKKIIEEGVGYEVTGFATDGIDAMAKTLRLQPDIITLDLEMPEMDGFSFLRWLMKERPTPVIMVSSYTDSRTVFKALELGAVDFIAKPTKRASIELQSVSRDLIRKLRGIKKIKLDTLNKNLDLLRQKDFIDESIKYATHTHATGKGIDIVAIGSSTGGPAALQIILTRLPADFGAAVVVSQHMPKGFTGPLAERLNKISHVYIKEAEDGDIIEEGKVYIAPGGYNMGLKKKGDRSIIYLREGRISDKYTPSVDYMMRCAADIYGSASCGVLLTGMGNDGREGMMEIKKKGGYTIAESEISAVVFGMPAEAIKAGAVEKVLPVAEISAELLKVVQSRRQKKNL